MTYLRKWKLHLNQPLHSHHLSSEFIPCQRLTAAMLESGVVWAGVGISSLMRPHWLFKSVWPLSLCLPPLLFCLFNSQTDSSVTGPPSWMVSLVQAPGTPHRSHDDQLIRNCSQMLIPASGSRTLRTRTSTVCNVVAWNKHTGKSHRSVASRSIAGESD